MSFELSLPGPARSTPGPQATRKIDVTPAEADAWPEMSGAKSYEPFLYVERREMARLAHDETTPRREFCERIG
jgi:hypothetical protein